MGAEVMMIASIASTAFEFVGGMQQASAMEQQGAMQQQIYNMHAQQAQAVSERNALIMRDQAAYDAARLEEQGRSEQATAQRAAIEERRRKRLTQSRAQAVGAASGAGALDPTMLDIAGELEEEGEYNAMSRLFEGDTAAQGLRNSANLRQYEGRTGSAMELYSGRTQADLLRYQGSVSRAESKLAASNARMKAGGSLFSGGSNLYNKYAPSRETWANGDRFR